MSGIVRNRGNTLVKEKIKNKKRKRQKKLNNGNKHLYFCSLEIIFMSVPNIITCCP